MNTKELLDENWKEFQEEVLKDANDDQKRCFEKMFHSGGLSLLLLIANFIDENEVEDNSLRNFVNSLTQEYQNYLNTMIYQ